MIWIFLNNYIMLKINNYIDWLKYGSISFIIISVVTVGIYTLINPNEIKEILKIVKEKK